MRISDLLNAPWAITPDMLIQMRDIYVAHLCGEKADLEKIEAALGRPLDNKREGYSVQNGVAVIPVDGVLSKRMSLFARISGGTSTQALQQDLADAASDPMVHSIMLLIDSPGGEVDGTQATAQMVRAIRDEGRKPIVALADGLMASAAYWIGSAASEVYSTGDTAAVGSIGIVAQHTDYSKAEEQRGIKVTEITAGKYKRAASAHEPLTDAGRADIQAKVDHLYSIFVDEVAANRKTDSQTVLDKMADGRVFLGKQAINAGLIDGFASVPDLVAQLNKKRMTSAYAGAHALNSTEGENVMFIVAGAEVKTQAELDAAIAKLTDAAKAAGVVEGKAAGVADGATAERKRIQEVESNLLPGHADLINTLKFDGKTSGPEAAAQVLQAEKKLRADAGEKLKADANKAVPVSVPDVKTEAKKEDVKEAPADDDAKIAQAKDLAGKAQAYLAEQHKAGNTRMSIAEAVAHVSKAAKQ